MYPTRHWVGRHVSGTQSCTYVRLRTITFTPHPRLLLRCCTRALHGRHPLALGHIHEHFRTIPRAFDGLIHHLIGHIPGHSTPLTPKRRTDYSLYLLRHRTRTRTTRKTVLLDNPLPLLSSLVSRTIRTTIRLRITSYLHPATCYSISTRTVYVHR